MWQHLGTFLTGVMLQPWIVAGMGVAVAGLCFLLGRSFFRSRPAKPSPKVLLPRVVAERRAAQRRRGHAITVEMLRPDDPSSLQGGWVIDRSPGGLRVEVEQPVEVETVLKVRPSNAGETTPWTEVVVKSCLKEEGGFHVGLQFVRTPSYNVLMLFG
jgi:hypothetical protein